MFDAGSHPEPCNVKANNSDGNPLPIFLDTGSEFSSINFSTFLDSDASNSTPLLFIQAYDVACDACAGPLADEKEQEGKKVETPGTGIFTLIGTGCPVPIFVVKTVQLKEINSPLAPCADLLPKSHRLGSLGKGFGSYNRLFALDINIITILIDY